MDDHTHATADDLVDDVIDHLLREPDVRLRWDAVRLVAGQLDRVRALTAKQAELETGSIKAAGKRLGIGRQYIDELYRKAGIPGPRTDWDRADRPAHRYGQLLAACHQIARHAGTEALMLYDKREPTAAASTAAWPAMRRAAEGWLTALVRRGADGRALADTLRRQLADAEAAAAELITAHRHLTLAEQGDVYLAHGSAMAAARQQE